MVPLSRLREVCAERKALRAENAELRKVALGLLEHFYLFNDKARRKLEAMGAAMPEDALPILMDGTADAFAVIAKLAKDGD